MRRAEGRELLTAYFVVLALTVVRAVARQLRAAAILSDPRLCPQVSYGIHNYLFDAGNDEANTTAAFNATLEDEKVLEQSELVYIFMVLFLLGGFGCYIKTLSQLTWHEVAVELCPCHRKRRQIGITSSGLGAAADDDPMGPRGSSGEFMGDIRTSTCSSDNGDVLSGRDSAVDTYYRYSRGTRGTGGFGFGRLSTRSSRYGTQDISLEALPPILQGLSFTVARGELVVVCGVAAFGKTTLFRLLTKMAEPESGEVSTHLGPGAIVACVEQETFIFDTTIKDNVRVGNPTASVKTIERAAAAAGVDKRRFDVSCGAGGKLLSPAEAQRVGIARGFLRIATAVAPTDSLLILDDPFSFQDPDSAGNIISHLQRLVSLGTTVVVLTQHSALCRAADTILVLEEGTLKECGTHEDLVASRSLYCTVNKISDSFDVSCNGTVTHVRGSGLSNYWIFASLDAAARSTVAKAFVPTSYSAAEVIYEHGDTNAGSLYIVTRGQVELVTNDGVEEPHVLAKYGVGQIFGSLVSLRAVEQEAVVRCRTATDVVALSRSSLTPLCRRFPALQQSFDTCAEIRTELDSDESVPSGLRSCVRVPQLTLALWEQATAHAVARVWRAGRRATRGGALPAGNGGLPESLPALLGGRGHQQAFPSRAGRGGDPYTGRWIQHHGRSRHHDRRGRCLRRVCPQPVRRCGRVRAAAASGRSARTWCCQQRRRCAPSDLHRAMPQADWPSLSPQGGRAG